MKSLPIWFIIIFFSFENLIILYPKKPLNTNNLINRADYLAGNLNLHISGKSENN